MNLPNGRISRTLVLLFFLLSAPLISEARRPKILYHAVVAVPVADVRASSGTLPAIGEYDPEQETQLLYGDAVSVEEESGDWVWIHALDQEEFSHAKRWEGYPGWALRSSLVKVWKLPWVNTVVRKKSAQFFIGPEPEGTALVLSMGTRLFQTSKVRNGFRKVKTVEGKTGWIKDQDLRSLKGKTSEDQARRLVLESASQLLGDSYFWGGCSAHLPELKDQVTAVDCSGLVYLAHRVAGIDIPRDSLEQYMKSKKIGRTQLKPGDLVFSASKENPEKVTHVAIIIDRNTLLEAPKTGERVRKVSFQEKYGVPLDQIEDGKIIGDRVLHFGTYFENR